MKKYTIPFLTITIGNIFIGIIASLLIPDFNPKTYAIGVLFGLIVVMAFVKIFKL